jgi:hypothetical protein
MRRARSPRGAASVDTAMVVVDMQNGSAHMAACSRAECACSVASDIAWLTFIERSVVVLRGDPRRRRWDLRVTEVFRRADGGWERVHRHADPLVDRRSVLGMANLIEQRPEGE